MIRRRPISTRTVTLVPYTTLFRSRLRARSGPALQAPSRCRPPPQLVEGGVARVRHARRHILEATQAREQRRLAERSEEHTSELQSLMRISYAVFCLKKKKNSRIQMRTSQTYHRRETHENRRS